MSDCTEGKEGKVVKLSKGRAFVEIERNAACSGCKACVFATKKRLVLPADNRVGAKLGDTVTVLPPKQKSATAYVMLFAIPLAALIIGLLLMYLVFGKETAMIIGAFVGLAIGLCVVLVLDRLVYSKKYISVIVKIHQGEINNND